MTSLWMLFQFTIAALTIDDDNERQLLNGEAYLVQSVLSRAGAVGISFKLVARVKRARLP